MSHSLLALFTVPVVTGVIGYVTNWTGVLMLFYPVHFKGLRAPWLRRVSRLLPYRVRQIPGVMIGGIGWQGIVPSRAAKMGSLAVDSGISKIGTPREIFGELDQEKIAEHIIESSHDEMGEVVDRIMEREQPQLWHDLPQTVKQMVNRRVESQLPDIVHQLTAEIGEHIDQLVDVKLMVIKRFDPELANRVFLDMGRRELKFIQNFGFVFGFALGIPVAILTHFVTFWWLLPILGILVGWVTNWVALWMIYEPADPQQWGPVRMHGLFIRRQHDVAEVYARIVADEILTVSEFGRELLSGPQSDRTRSLIERSMRPAIDRATGPLQPAVRAALGPDQYDSIRDSFATEPVDHLMEPLTDPQFSRSQSATMRKLITERIRAMPAPEFADLLRTATREDEWLLLLHGAALGLAGGLIHLGLFRVSSDFELQDAPALARVAAGMWWRAAKWGMIGSVRAGLQMGRVAADPVLSAEVVAELAHELREYARDLLGITELDERVRELMPVPEDAGAGNGKVPEAVGLRIKGALLLRAAAEVDHEEQAHPAYARILTELAPDEGRILRLLAREGPQPTVDVRSTGLIGSSAYVAEGLNMVGAQAGCQYRDRMPGYLNNLERLGLVCFSDEPLEDSVAYQVLEAQPEVMEAIKRATRAKTIQRSIRLTAFGQDFCLTCLPLDPAEVEALAPYSDD